MKIKTLIAAVGFVVAAGSAYSAPMSVACDLGNPDVTSYVTGTSACYFLTGTDGNVSNDIAEFNATNFGGYADWVDLGKVDPVGSNANYEVKDNVSPLLKGTWEVFANATTNMYTTFALVFKAGQDDNTDPASQVGYILSASSGDWMSPLINDKSGNPRTISHVNLYARDKCDPVKDICGPPVTQVPVPASLPLMMGALGIVGFVARRRRNAAG
ncbi:MAG: VPLPA-CTERM sorting domain-containing protein [Arenibacterium sp.]